MTDKEKIIRQVWYDKDTGFGSIADTYKDAKQILNTITLNDVKVFMEKQQIQQLKAYKGFNSYVAKKPLQEIQADLGDFTASGALNHGYRYLHFYNEGLKKRLVKEGKIPKERFVKSSKSKKVTNLKSSIVGMTK